MDNSWVDDFGVELGKRNLTFLTPEEDPSEGVYNQAQPEPDSLVTLDDEGFPDYFKNDVLPHTTVHEAIEVMIGYYLYKFFQQRAVKTCIYCVYLNELCRVQCHSCIDILPLHCLEGHMEEIKRDIFNENNANAQSYVLFCLGLSSHAPPNTQDIAESILKKWLTTPFLTTRLKHLTSGREKLNTVVQDSLKIWDRKRS